MAEHPREGGMSGSQVAAMIKRLDGGQSIPPSWRLVELLAIFFVVGMWANQWRVWRIDEKIWVEVRDVNAPPLVWHRWGDPGSGMPAGVLVRVIAYTSLAVLLSAGALFVGLRWSYRLIHCS